MVVATTKNATSPIVHTSGAKETNRKAHDPDPEDHQGEWNEIE
jgi:hypothetical protein